jgi:ferrochelatase
MNPTSERSGVLLMTYGSPASLEDVPRYVRAVRGGREVPAEVITEFRRRYEVIGGSPLIDITRAQAAALEERLGGAAMVRAAMRFSAPSIVEGLNEMANAGVREAVGIIMSPQFSPLLMGGYVAAVAEARVALHGRAPDVHLAGAWYREPAFKEAVAGRITAARDGAHVLLTAHSLPRRVAEQEPDYIGQLRETAEIVADAAGLTPDEWTFCWQSAGHEPGEWMKPDFADLMPQLAAAGHRSVLVAPIQFLADHLEILYDIDVAARQQAESAGLRFARIDSLNVDPGFIDALAHVVERAVAGGTYAVTTESLGHRRAASPGATGVGGVNLS